MLPRFVLMKRASTKYSLQDEPQSNLLFTNVITYRVLQTCQVLSLLAHLFVGYHLLFPLQTLKTTPSRHVIVLLLTINFIQLHSDIPFALQYLDTGVVRPSFPATCSFWMFVTTSTYSSSLLLMAWASFERHLLIFHSHWLNTRRRRILVHYSPMVCICLYTTIYYIFVIFFYPFVNNFDYAAAFCGFVCYLSLPTPTLYGIELIVYQVLPTFLIGFFSGSLIV